MIILGIDPWTTTIWYAAIVKDKNTYTILDYGVISTTPKIPLEDKLLEMWNDFCTLLDKYYPDRVCIEKLYFNTNITTGISVSQARWVLIYETTKKWIWLSEYTPLQVKKAITGNGRATKKQLQNAIMVFFWLTELPTPDDAADAIAIAYMWALEI